MFQRGFELLGVELKYTQESNESYKVYYRILRYVNVKKLENAMTIMHDILKEKCLCGGPLAVRLTEGPNCEDYVRPFFNELCKCDNVYHRV